MAAHLVGLNGIYAGQTLALGPAETTIGREAANVIPCEADSSVSRRHARLMESVGSFSIEDLASSNGTFVNGARIAGVVPIKSGDEIRIGGQSFRFEIEVIAAPPVQPPPGGIAPPRPREVSRGEQPQPGLARGTERIYGGTGSDMPGCTLPQIDLPDLSGCLRILMLLLIALVIVAIIGGLLMLLSAGLGALGGLGGGGSHGHTTTNTGGGQPPAQSGNSGGGTGGDQSSEPGIRIRLVKIAAGRSGSLRFFVTWDNLTNKPVHRITARVSAVDAQGNAVSKPDVVIYDGKDVAAGETHEDNWARNEGFASPPEFGAKPTDGKVEVTRFE
jgi:hypothetical protein